MGLVVFSERQWARVSGSSLILGGDLKGGGLLSQENQSKACRIGFQREDLTSCLAGVGPSLWFYPARAPHTSELFGLPPSGGPHLKLGLLRHSAMVWSNCQRPLGPSISVPSTPSPHCG